MEAVSNFVQGLSYPTWVAIGIVIRLWVGMRQFNRRGWGGLQHFRNYFIGVLTLFLEGLLKWGSWGLIVWGLGAWILGG